MHDPDYRAALQDFTTFTEHVSEKVIEADETIPELPVKDVVSIRTRHFSVSSINNDRFIAYTEVRTETPCQREHTLTR